MQTLLPRTDQSETSPFLLVDGRGVRDTGGEGGVRDEAGLTAAPVATHGVQTVSVGTHALQLALIKILAVGIIDALVSLGAVHRLSGSSCCQRNRWFWALLAFVEPPGCSDALTAFLLLAETREGLAALCASGLLEAASQLAVGDRLVLGYVALLVGVDDVVSLLLDLLAAL